MVYETKPAAAQGAQPDADPEAPVGRRDWVVSIVASGVISAAAVAIGTHRIDIGKAAIVLMPIIWAVLLGGLIGVQRLRPITGSVRSVGDLLIRIGIVFFLACLGTEIGPSLGKLTDLGPAIVMQEIGHIFGTVILALPLGVALGLGRAAIGAGWSIDRESYLAYAIERFGIRSPEYRGVFGVWLIGTIFGALYISFLAGLLGSLDWLHPQALALGLGMGSASMMLGGLGALGALYPDQLAELTALAGLSNLVTNIVGFYAGVFLALPVCKKLYAFWTRVFRRPTAEVEEARKIARGEPVPEEEAGREALALHTIQDPVPPKGRGAVLLAYLVTGVLGLLMNRLGTGDFAAVQIVGVLMLLLLTAAAFRLAALVPRIPASVWVLAITTLTTATFMPTAEPLLHSVEGLKVMLVGLPQIALIGMNLGRDVGALRHLSWRVVVIALTSLTASFVISAVLAQTVLHL